MVKKAIGFLLLITILSACHSKSSPNKETKIKRERVTVEHTSPQTSTVSEKTEEVHSIHSTKEEIPETTQPTSDAVTTTSPPATPVAPVGKKVLLEVPQQYQQAWNWCVPATASMMLAYKGIHVSQAQLARDMRTNESFGTHNANAIQILNRYLFGYDHPSSGQAGYRLATVTNAHSQSEDMRLFKERLVKNINDGYPMYYTFDNARLYPGKSGEHNAVGIGYQLSQDGSDVAYVYYLDPSYAVKDSTYGGLKKVTPEELLFAMLTCVEPNYGW